MTVNLRRHRTEALGGARARAPQQASLAELARRPLFEPLAALLEALPGPGPSSLAQLQVLYRDRAGHAPELGRIRFVPPDDDRSAYEERIVARGEIVTRPHHWHDFFNALAWVRFARTKASLARLHVEGMRTPRPGGGRGPLRDAATQFDESGIVAAASDPDLLDLLAARRWKAFFWERRDRLRQQARFVVFGHGLYDALRAPFHGLCGRAVTVLVSQATLTQPIGPLCAELDAVLAARFAARTWYTGPKALLPLPVLGIPGMCAGNADPTYYEDPAQFRPLPRA